MEILRMLSMENRNGKSVAIAIGAKPLVVLHSDICFI